MAILGYVQVTRACNQSCRFCSNPPSGHEIDLVEARRRVEDLAERHYDGVILTGGEPTLVPWLPALVSHATHLGLATRIITNGQRLANGELLDDLRAAGLRHLHVSVYSHDPDIHDGLTRNPGSHDRAMRTLTRVGDRPGLSADVNCVIHSRNAGALDRVAALVVEGFPHVRHMVFNNLDARMNRVAENPDTVPRLIDMELSLARAMRFLDARGRTFRVERVPLCYMAEWAHCSTETRKLVKAEERTIHFLDQKGTVRQSSSNFVHARGLACAACRVRDICGGLDGLGEWHDGRELHPIFLDPADIAARVLRQGG